MQFLFKIHSLFWGVLLIGLMSLSNFANATTTLPQPSNEQAKNVEVFFSLSKISSDIESKFSGEEIYVVITEFSDGKHGRQFTVPRYPVHWPARAIKQIKHVSIWSGQVLPGKDVSLHFELVSHALLSVIGDDVLGAAKLQLINTNGQLKSAWLPASTGITEHKVLQTPEGNIEEFVFRRHDDIYIMRFNLKELAQSDRTIEQNN